MVDWCMKSHTGATMLMSKGGYSTSGKQKHVTWSSTEVEIVIVHDVMLQLIWTGYFLIHKVSPLKIPLSIKTTWAQYSLKRMANNLVPKEHATWTFATSLLRTRSNQSTWKLNIAQQQRCSWTSLLNRYKGLPSEGYETISWTFTQVPNIILTTWVTGVCWGRYPGPALVQTPIQTVTSQPHTSPAKTRCLLRPTWRLWWVRSLPDHQNCSLTSFLLLGRFTSIVWCASIRLLLLLIGRV